MDKRIYHSKLQIAKTLFQRLEKDNFHVLTVSEITAYAEVSRSTFYRHFRNKYAVVEFFMETLLDDYLAEVERQGVKDFESLLVLYFNFWTERKGYIDLLKRQHLLDLAFDVQRKKLLRLLPDSSLPWHGMAEVDETFTDLLVIGGIWTILLYWFENGLNLTDTELAHKILQELNFYKNFINKEVD